MRKPMHPNRSIRVLRLVRRAVLALVIGETHIVPPACGGPDKVSNLQWQTIRDARAKDTWERKACVR
jgi:hypothetical protein